MIKKKWALLMAASMVLTCTACNSDTKTTKEQEKETEKTTVEETTVEETTVEETTVEETTEAETEVESEIVTEEETEAEAGTITYFSLTMGTSDAMKSMNVYDNGDGTIYVDYNGEERKIGYLDDDLFEEITNEFAKTGLEELNGESVYEEGDELASMYIAYDNDTYVMADYSGEIAEVFISGYEAMDEYFQILTEDIPVYIPQPMVMGEVDEDALAAITAVLEASGIENVDSLAISDVPIDDNFGITMGLSKTDGIVSGTSCSTMMMAQAYSFVIATVEDEKDIAAVRKDFEKNLDENWNKWVCVSASDAMIAQQDNMVLCLMGFEDMFDMTAEGIEESGWTEIETFENPNM